MADNIRVIDPLTPAFRTAKAMLFQPFNLQRWLAIGFCAWLARLGQNGTGGGVNYKTAFGKNQNQGRTLERANEWVNQNLECLLPVLIGAIALGLAVWIVFIWLSSRGRFMFLHSVIRNSDQVRAPWTAYAPHGNSLCIFRLVMGVITLPLVLACLAGCGFLIYRMVDAGEARPGWLTGAIGLGLAVALILFVFFIIAKLTRDFVEPIMFLRQPNCLEAWKEFWPVLWAQFWPIVLYLLFCIVLQAGVAVAVLIVSVATCCIAGCLLAIPYVGTVLFLPVLVFLRAYPLHFFAQFGPNYNVWPNTEPTQPSL